MMHDCIEHGTERKIGIDAKQACQAAKRVWLCGMWCRWGRRWLGLGAASKQTED